MHTSCSTLTGACHHTKSSNRQTNQQAHSAHTDRHTPCTCLRKLHTLLYLTTSIELTIHCQQTISTDAVQGKLTAKQQAVLHNQKQEKPTEKWTPQRHTLHKSTREHPPGWQKAMPAAPAIPRRSPIQVLGWPNTA